MSFVTSSVLVPYRSDEELLEPDSKEECGTCVTSSSQHLPSAARQCYQMPIRSISLCRIYSSLHGFI